MNTRLEKLTGAGAADLRDVMTTDRSEHLDSVALAGYVDNALDAAALARAQQHLARCRRCRDEVIAVQSLLRQPTWSGREPATRWIAGAAAAAVLLMFLPWRGDREPIHRDAPVASIGAPRAIGPVGTVSIPAPALTWSAVPNADRYVVRVFNERGDVVWESDTRDTSAVVGTSLTEGRRFFWLVEAHTGFGRSVNSVLVEFTVRTGR